MKLRIKGDSIRFRLLRSEVEALIEKGFLSEETRFTAGPSGSLYYGLIVSFDTRDIEAKFEGDRIMIVLPKIVVEKWAKSDNVGIEASQNGLDILIEKDFACPGRPDDPENANAF
jgi:hypothetical protein